MLLLLLLLLPRPLVSSVRIINRLCLRAPQTPDPAAAAAACCRLFSLLPLPLLLLIAAGTIILLSKQLSARRHLLLLKVGAASTQLRAQTSKRLCESVFQAANCTTTVAAAICARCKLSSSSSSRT